MSGDKRAFTRHQVQWNGRIIFLAEPCFVDCDIHNISDAGACVRMQISIALPRVVLLWEQRMGMLLKCNIIWRKEHMIGLQFTDVRCRAEKRAMLGRCLATLSPQHADTHTMSEVKVTIGADSHCI
jgi:hypothetical protein